jgi:hypothetical protein
MDRDDYLKLEIGMLATLRQVAQSLRANMPHDVHDAPERRKALLSIDRQARNIMRQNPHRMELLVSDDWEDPSGQASDETEDCPDCSHRRFK